MSSPWVDGISQGEALSRIATEHGDRDAVVFPRLELRWSYAELEERVKQVARALMALGVMPGDHVGIWATNWPEWILAQFAVPSIGAVLVNVNPAYRVNELDYILRQADIKALLLTDRFKQSDYAAMMAELDPSLDTTAFGEKRLRESFPRLEHVVSIKNAPSRKGIWPWEEFLARHKSIAPAALKERTAAVRADDPTSIQYTSGTTGHPKGATLSHRNILLNAYYAGDRLHFTQYDRLCIPVPLYHCFGCVLGTLLCMLRAAAMVIPAESFDPAATLEAVEKERCTALHGVPTMFNAEIHLPDFGKYELSTLRTGVMAGSLCPTELMRQVIDLMHLEEMTIAYGLTEASPLITQTETTEPLEIRVTTIGKPIPGVDVRIVDPLTLQDVDIGQPGELWARGHGIMLGYYNKPEATREAIVDGRWLRTGDLAIQTQTGHYCITGRIKDMIIRGGENIYPREIEEFLLKHPKIYDVQIVGLPDAHYGEQVSAWIVSKDSTLTADDVRAFCNGEIAHYKIPHYIEFVKEFPMTVSGKIQKFVLREEGIKRFGPGKPGDANNA